MNRFLLVLLAVTAVLLTSACSRSGERLGAGSDVDLCDGWELIDRLDEPDLADRGATLRWAEGVQRIVERIDLRMEVDDEPVPAAVIRNLSDVEQAVDAFVTELRRDDEDAVRRAFTDFANGDFDGSSDRLTDFARSTC